MGRFEVSNDTESFIDVYFNKPCIALFITALTKLLLVAERETGIAREFILAEVIRKSN